MLQYYVQTTETQCRTAPCTLTGAYARVTEKLVRWCEYGVLPVGGSDRPHRIPATIRQGGTATTTVDTITKNPRACSAPTSKKTEWIRLSGVRFDRDRVSTHDNRSIEGALATAMMRVIGMKSENP